MQMTVKDLTFQNSGHRQISRLGEMEETCVMVYARDCLEALNSNKTHWYLQVCHYPTSRSFNGMNSIILISFTNDLFAFKEIVHSKLFIQRSSKLLCSAKEKLRFWRKAFSLHLTCITSCERASQSWTKASIRS